MSTKVVFLGTGAAIPLRRGLPCIGLRVGPDIYLLDVGEGCQHRLFRHGLSPLRVKAIFITHLHGDHYLGVFGLLQTMHLMRRSAPLVVHAPRGFGELAGAVLGPVAKRLGYPVEIKEVTPGVLYAGQGVEVRAFPVNHTVEAYGFYLKIGGKTLCYTGDTAPTLSVVENCASTHILVHEATFTSDEAEEAREEKHSTARDAAIIASRTGAKTLVLTHISARHDKQELLRDATRYFQNTIVAEDGQTLYL